MNARTFLSSLGVVALLVPLAEARKWSDDRGNSLNAEYVRIHEGQVLLRQGSRLLRFPYDRFSEEDKAYIREKMEADRERKNRSAMKRTGGPVVPEARDDDARELRTWTDARGRKILAQYVGFLGTDIELIKDGKRVSYPFELFSPTDQKYVVDILISEGRADEIPKKDGESDDSTGPESEYSESDYTESDVAEAGYEPSSPAESIDSEYEVTIVPDSPQPEAGSGSEEDYASSHASASHSNHSGSSSRPDFNAGSRRNSFPDTSSHSPHSSGPVMEPVYQKQCTKCGGLLPDDTEIGDRCPHCNVLFSYEKGMDGKLRDKSGKIVSKWAARGGGVGLVVFFVVLGLRLLGSVAGRS